MLSAKLRHRIDIEQLTITRDQWGGVIETWTKFATGIPAAIVPLSGKEYIASSATQATVDTRMTIRFISGVLPSMRVLFGNVKYNIRAVLPDPTLQRHLTLMCETGANDG